MAIYPALKIQFSVSLYEMYEYAPQSYKIFVPQVIVKPFLFRQLLFCWKKKQQKTIKHWPYAEKLQNILKF